MKTLFDIKMPIDVKLVKLIFRLYFPKDIFKMFTIKVKECSNHIKIVVYKIISYNAIKKLNI